VPIVIVRKEFIGGLLKSYQRAACFFEVKTRKIENGYDFLHLTACYGIENIPGEWIDSLENRDYTYWNLKNKWNRQLTPGAQIRC